LVFTPSTPMHLDQRCRTHGPRAASHGLCGGAPLHRCHMCKVVSGTPMRTRDPQHRLPLPENLGTGIRAVLCHAPRLAPPILTHFLSLVLAYLNNQLNDDYAANYVGTRGAPPRNQHKVLEARLGNLTLANSMPVDGGTKVGGDLDRHQTRTSPETLVQEGSPDTVVTERNSGRTEQGRSRGFGTRAKPQVQTWAQATSLGSSRWTSLKRTVSGETINTPGLTTHKKASAGRYVIVVSGR
jgi:hypothetical protein